MYHLVYQYLDKHLALSRNVLNRQLHSFIPEDMEFIHFLQPGKTPQRGEKIFSLRIIPATKDSQVTVPIGK